MRQLRVTGAGEHVIRLDSVTKTYQAGAPPALADVSMGVAAGEVVAIMGPSGSGKSTLLNLVNSPELLLADEPTGALDTASGQEIGKLLRELNADGQTLVLVTHDPALARRFAARTVQLVDGQVVAASAGVPA